VSIFARGQKLYAKCKGVDGKWRQLATGCSLGEEAKARRWLDDLERQVAASRASGATSGPLTVARWAASWLQGRERLGLDWTNDEQRLRTHVLPVIGALPLSGVRPRHLVDLFARLRTEGTIAPRTIYNIYSVVKALFRDARLADHIEQTPCILTAYQLGPLVDKDPDQRGDAVFTRGELEQLLADPRVPDDRQLVYALEGLAGLRHGEMAGLRWRHVDATKTPLGQLTIATSYDRGRTKTGAIRRVPVHPVLAAMLAEWKLHGWARMMGRVPEPDDLVVPLPPAGPRTCARANPRAGGMRSKNDSRWRWLADLAALGLRHRRGHDLRATFITLAEDDGADPNVLARITHTAKGRSAYKGYSRTQWDTLCRELGKLQIRRSSRGDVIALPLAVAAGGATPRDPTTRTPERGAVVVQTEKSSAISGTKGPRRRGSYPGSTRPSPLCRGTRPGWRGAGRRPPRSDAGTPCVRRSAPCRRRAC